MNSEPDSPAAVLRAMADRIEKNDPDDFAGCIIAIPPLNEGTGTAEGMIEILLLDPARDETNFWGLARTKVNAEGGRYDQRADIPTPGSYR